MYSYKLFRQASIFLVLINDKIYYTKNFITSVNPSYIYNELVDKEFLILNNNHLYIPEDKWYISNEIIVRLLNNR